MEIIMVLGKNYFAFMSLSVVSIAFLSSCNKGSSGNSNASNNTQVPSSKNEDPNKLTHSDCTDLDNTLLNPLGKYQWHLKNTGQTAFASTVGIAGEDLNVSSVLKNECLSGKGIYVAVVDSGLELEHPSLSPNIENKPGESKTWSLNFRNDGLGINDPSPISGDDRDHGTMVSGIIAMRSNLGFGGSGVAPRAHLSGYNYLGGKGTQTTQNRFDSLGQSVASSGNDIFNMSWGTGSIYQIPESSLDQLPFKVGVLEMRNKKGAIFVKSAGNGFYKLNSPVEIYDNDYLKACESAVMYKITCQNSNMDNNNTLPEIITVGALSAIGKKSSYSTTGSSLWVSAPGGEFGWDKKWIDDLYAKQNKVFDWNDKKLISNPINASDPAIITTDHSGSKDGFSKQISFDNLKDISFVRNTFNAGLAKDENGKLLNADFNYTNSMNGTSSAAPNTSGSIALILEANPNLSWRDVKYILANTSTKVDRSFEGIFVNFTNGDYQAEQGWVKNAAGYVYSNWYGFGRVNVGEAVKLAKKYDVNLGEYVEGSWQLSQNDIAIFIPQGNPSGIERTITSTEKDENLIIESVRVKVSADSGYIGDVGFELTSPSGTKSIIWNVGNAFSFNGNLVNKVILTNAFYGENSTGDWKLKVINSGLHKQDAVFKSWAIQVSGQKSPLK
jgi:subtilisin-like proprotein convertase family protein